MRVPDLKNLVNRCCSKAVILRSNIMAESPLCLGSRASVSTIFSTSTNRLPRPSPSGSVSCFGDGAGVWTRMQGAYDTWNTEREMSDEIKRIPTIKTKTA